VLTLREDPAASRKILPTKSAGKRRASAEHVLSRRAKRQSRRSREGECPFASDAEPVSVPAAAPSRLRAKEYPITILLPIQEGRNVVIRNGLPARLATLLRDEVNNWLTGDYQIRQWNDIEPKKNADCMLKVARGSVGWGDSFRGEEASRACRDCSANFGDSRLIIPKPCIMLREDTKVERYILFLPLAEDLREGKGWKERGFWVNEMPRPPTPDLDALRAHARQNDPGDRDRYSMPDPRDFGSGRRISRRPAR